MIHCDHNPISETGFVDRKRAQTCHWEIRIIFYLRVFSSGFSHSFPFISMILGFFHRVFHDSWLLPWVFLHVFPPCFSSILPANLRAAAPDVVSTAPAARAAARVWRRGHAPQQCLDIETDDTGGSYYNDQGNYIVIV